jgi:hypothetical protein
MPVTGRGGPCGCEMLRIPNCLGNRLTDCGEASLTCRQCFILQQDFLLLIPVSLSRHQRHSPAGRITTSENPIDIIGTRTRDLSACSVVSEATTLPLITL